MKGFMLQRLYITVYLRSIYDLQPLQQPRPHSWMVCSTKTDSSSLASTYPLLLHPTFQLNRTLVPSSQKLRRSITIPKCTRVLGRSLQLNRIIIFQYRSNRIHITQPPFSRAITTMNISANSLTNPEASPTTVDGITKLYPKSKSFKLS